MISIMIQWNDPEPMKSGGEVKTSTCGRFRLYKSFIDGWAVGYRVNEFAPWKPIDPLHGGQPRWHQSRKSALTIVESFAEQYNGTPLPVSGAIVKREPVLVPSVSSPSNLRSTVMSENETNVAVADVAAAPKRRKKKAEVAVKTTKAGPAKKKGAKATKKAAKPSENGSTRGRKKDESGLTPSQRKVLEVLSRNSKPLTRNDLKEKTGINKGWTKMLGASTKEVAEDSLEGMGMIRSMKHEGDRSISYEATPKGRKLVSK